MSGYSARKAPNVSQYIANLNTLPSAHDIATGQDGYPLDDDLAIFTNAEFFDFDLGENYDPSMEGRTKQATAAKNNDAKDLSYDNGRCTIYVHALLSSIFTAEHEFISPRLWSCCV